MIAAPCGECGRELRPEARFCTACGSAAGNPVVEPPTDPFPAPRPRTGGADTGGRRVGGRAVVAVVLALVVVAAAGAAVVLLRPGTADQPPVAATLAEPVPPTAPSSSLASPTTVPVGAALQLRADADRAAVEGLVGQWVPQLSSKNVGLVVDGISYDEARIWSEFQLTAGTYPDAALVRSADYLSFRRPGYWVIILTRTFPSADEVNAWCDREGLGPDDCFGKRLSHTAGPSGNTAPRR